MPAQRQAPKACRPVERFTCIVPRGRTRRAWSGARGPMPQAAAFDESPRHRQIPQVRAFVESNCIRRLQHDRPQPTAFDITAQMLVSTISAPCQVAPAPPWRELSPSYGARATKARRSCNKTEILRLDFAIWLGSDKSQLGFYLPLLVCHFTKMDSGGAFQPQNLKFVARKARLASNNASDTHISWP